MKYCFAFRFITNDFEENPTLKFKIIYDVFRLQVKIQVGHVSDLL